MVNYKNRRYSKRHHKAASSIASAWRRRKRAKVGLVQRTVTANRRRLSILSKGPEVKENLGSTWALPGAAPNQYAGQQFRTGPNIAGVDSTGVPTVINPLAISRGTGPNNRVGTWVKMTSLSYKIQVNCETGALAADSNRVGVIVVLDTAPLTSPAPNLNATVSNDGTLLGTGGAAGNTSPWLQFKYKGTTTEPDARYKILKHHRGIVQPQAAGSTKFTSLVFHGSIKSPYKFEYPPLSTGIAPDQNLPTNQRILLFCYSDSVVFPAPQFTGFCRFRFRDT